MLTILIADDSKVQKVVISKFLKEKGYIVLDAKDGNEAYEIAEKVKPDLILMDVVMPNCNGFQSLRKIKANDNLKEIPVIMVSTKNTELDMVWAKRQGASGYITKPVDFDLLMEEIKKNSVDLSTKL